jgi:hypothetical protein
MKEKRERDVERGCVGWLGGDVARCPLQSESGAIKLIAKDD